MNANFTDIATGLSNVLTRDGQAGMTAAFKAISGSLAAPGISFTSDPTSGLYLSATGIVGLVAHSLGMLLNTSIFSVTAAAVQSGGSNYAVGDTITETGGTAIMQPVFTVATVSGTAVATVTVSYPGYYTTKPSNPVAQGSTSGIGTGATFNLTYNDPTSNDYRAIFTDQASALIWQKMGSSSFVSGLMAKVNGLDFATAIGGSNIAAAIGSSFIIPPQGVLSPLISTTAPIPTSDITAANKIYWTPYRGNGCPIYNGTTFVNVTSGQLNCDLIAGTQVLNGIFDIYKFLSAGSPKIALSPNWTAGTGGSVTAGSCARGSGVGGTALTWAIGGIPTNAAAMTLNDGSGSYSILANQGTYLGSVYINAVAGQYNCLLSYGQSRVYGLWNAFNRNLISLKAGDPNANWAAGGTSGGTLRSINNNPANSMTVFCGLAEERVDSSFYQIYTAAQTAGVTIGLQTGIGFNSTTAASGVAPATSIGSSGSASTLTAENSARFVVPPFVGTNVLTALEGATASGPTSSGTEKNCSLIANWMG